MPRAPRWIGLGSHTRVRADKIDVVTPHHEGRALRWTRNACGALGVLLILAALLLGYATRSLFNERAFADRIAASLEDPRFAGFVAEQIADAVIEAKPDLIGLRPVLVGVGRSVVSSAPFRAAVRRSARTLHHTIMSGTGKNIVLTVKDVGALLESAAETHPGLAKRIPAGVSAALGQLEAIRGGELAVPLIRIAKRMRAGTLLLLFLGLTLCVTHVWLARDRRRAIVGLGVALAVIGLVLGIVSRFGGDLLGLMAQSNQRPAIVGLIGTYLRGLMTWAAGLGFAGLVLSAASASLLERVPIQSWAAHTRQWLTGPQPRMRLRLARGVLGAAVGALLLFWPMPSLTVIGWLFGVVVAFAGLREAFVAALHLLPHELRAERVRDAGRPRGNAVALVTALSLVLIAVAALILFRSGREPDAPQDVTACNGAPELCDQSLDRVVFPTTHNSMGAPDETSWMFPNQGAGIARQLEDGIRGFMIDVHYGVPVGDKVKTEAGRREGRDGQVRGGARQGGHGRGAPDPRPAGGPSRGRPGRLPLPRILRARGDEAGAGPARRCATSWSRIPGRC